MVSIDTLTRQAPMTVSNYFNEAVDIIDARFGNGYAKANPHLIATFISACVVDFQTMMQQMRDDLDR
jgi:hypothetical protein